MNVIKIVGVAALVEKKKQKEIDTLFIFPKKSSTKEKGPLKKKQKKLKKK